MYIQNFLSRRDEEFYNANISIVKARNTGKLGTFKCHFDLEKRVFISLTEDKDNFII